MDPYTDLKYTIAASNSLSDEDNEAGSSSKPKRGSRACDRCRKIKSKCELADGDRCKNCSVSGTPCTFQGPSFKRGPPKGYIHAIEQRWQQVECILATIMSSPRSESMMTDLRQDAFARSVLDRVESGPYGQANLSHRAGGTSQESFYDAVMGLEHGSAYEDRRSRRQSRVSREIVSSQDATFAVPTSEWQNQIAQRLAHSSGISSPRSRTSFSSPTATSCTTVSESTSGTSEPVRRRARLEGLSLLNTTARGPHDMYTSGDSYYGDYTATMDALGHLSVNENQDIRYHDKSAGLHLLAHSVRNDDAQTQENGIWKFRSPKSDPTSSESNAEPYIPIHWPPSVVQDHLIHLYFTYVHPFYPVVHKSSFLGLYNARKFMYVAYDKSSTLFLKGFFSPIDSPKSRYAKSIQGISDLLLLSMFAFAARYSDDEMRAQPSVSTLHDQVASGGRLYAEDARKVLNTVYQHSRPSTCQALLLMGVREFGVGSTEQGWLFVGMACRMAVDLGMNHNADEWKDSRGEFLFSIPDRQARRQIWASCCIADKLSSIWQGRPVMFRECDYNVNFPTVVEAEEMVTWQPYPPNALGADFKPEPGRIMSNFREQCKLSLIMSEIMTKIYPVQPTPNTPKRAELEHLETRLHHWLFELPDHLRYREAGGRVMPLPHILALHIEYQFAVLLLHRAFIPNWNDPASSTNPGLEADALPMKSFDICQGAAAQISSTMSAFEEHYGLSRCPPLFIVFLQGAAIMHIVTLMRRPGNTQGTVGLMRCIDAAKAMETTWPCAIDVRRLLQGSRVQLDDVTAWESSKPSSSRPGKRAADDAFGMDGSTDVLQQDIFEMMAPRDQPHMQTPTTHTDDTPDGGTPYYAQALGVPVSMPVQSPNAFYSGFEWWPQSMLNMQQYGQAEGLRFYPSGNEQQQDQMSGYPAPQGPFTFDDGQLSSNFTDHVAGDDEPSGSQSHLHHSDQ